MKRGFTLIELLIVVVIIGILATMTMIGVSSVRVSARDSRRISDIKQIQSALELFFSDENIYPAAITPGLPLVGPNSGKTYMNKVPSNPRPVNDGDCAADLEYSYFRSASGLKYYLRYCLGKSVSQAPSGNNTAVPSNISNQIAFSSELNNGLVAYYKMEDATDDFAAYDLVNYGSTEFVSSQFGKAADFPYPNSTKHLYSNQTSVGVGDCSAYYTISFWFYMNEDIAGHGVDAVWPLIDMQCNPAYVTIVMHNDSTVGPRVRVNVGGNLGADNVDDILPNTWYHVVVTRSATKVYLYLNGTYKTEFDRGVGVGLNSDCFDIGHNCAAPFYWAPARFDEVRVYNRALSAQEVQELYYVY